MSTTTVSPNSTEVTATLSGESQQKAVVELLYVVLVYTLLEDKGFRFNNPCVGVLLRPNLVLTTLSCLEVSFHGAIDTDLMVVYVRNSQVLKPEKVILYPDEGGGPSVALILCESSHVHEFPRLPERELRVGDFDYCTLCGFGTGAETLNMENFTTMRIDRSEMEVCSREVEGQRWVCLHFDNAMPCRGDVGAPLLCGGALHAIFNPTVAPWAPPSCLDTYGATFTRVYPYVPWIQKVNSTLELSYLSKLSSPWCWIGLGVTALTIIVIIYCGIMKYVEWMCAAQEGQGEEEQRTLTARSSQMSRVTVATNRLVWPR